MGPGRTPTAHQCPHSGKAVGGSEHVHKHVTMCTMRFLINSDDFGRFWNYLADSDSYFVVAEIISRNDSIFCACVFSGFNHMPCDCTCACVVACFHTCVDQMHIHSRHTSNIHSTDTSHFANQANFDLGQPPFSTNVSILSYTQTRDGTNGTNETPENECD